MVCCTASLASPVVASRQVTRGGASLDEEQAIDNEAGMMRASAVR
ncbi:hypothetical protein [Sorangium sp. So ce363]